MAEDGDSWNSFQNADESHRSENCALEYGSVTPLGGRSKTNQQFPLRRNIPPPLPPPPPPPAPPPPPPHSGDQVSVNHVINGHWIPS